MPSADLLNLGSSPWAALALRAAWQSTALLATALLVARLFPMRPSRAHRILLASALACLIVPAASLAARRLDIGLFRGEAQSAPESPSVEAGATRPGPPAPVAPIPALVSVTRPTVALDPSPITETAAAPMSPPRDASPWWPHLDHGMLAAWALAAAIGLARIVASFASAARIRARSSPVHDPVVLAAADAAAKYLGLSFSPEVRASADVHCPVVWCWGRRPVLIVPDQAETWDDDRLAAILCHELAHWLRADHLSSLAAELLTCLLPWQPLAWRLRSRMADLAELACDDWALAHARSVSPDEYVEALLGLATNRRRPLVPAAVSSRAGLVARARHILEEGCSMPRIGRLWNALIAATCVGLITLLALAQTRQAKALGSSHDPADTHTIGEGEPGEETTVEGVVHDDKGKPVPGAEVVWVGPDQSPLRLVSMIPESLDSNKLVLTTRSRATSDAEGRFSLRAKVKDLWVGKTWAMIVGHKEGLAIGSTMIAVGGLKPAEVILKPAVPIAGRLLTPGGEPAAGVVVQLRTFYDDPIWDYRRFCATEYGNDIKWAERPSFYPGEYRTDESGRFVIDGIVPSGVFAVLSLDHPDFADEEIVVSTREKAEPEDARKFSGIQPLRRDFLHALTTNQHIGGTVLDEQTKQPLPGITVEVRTSSAYTRGSYRTITDTNGRYRVAARQNPYYWVSAYPSTSSGYMRASNTKDRVNGDSELKVDLPLRRGIVFRGTVVDEETGTPIPDVSVGYRPRWGSPEAARFGGDGISLTDAQGHFALTGVPGPGVVGAEARSSNYIRFAAQPVDFDGMQSSHPYVHGLARIDLPSEGSPREIQIKLRKGFTLEANVLHPDGSPAGDLRAWHPQVTAYLFRNYEVMPNTFPGGLFRLFGAEAGRTYRVFFFTEDQKWGAVAELKADPARKGPIEVRLQPTASMRGRIVDAQGKLVEGQTIYHKIQLVDREPPVFSEEERRDQFVLATYPFLAGKGMDLVSPADFHFSALIPGVRYFVAWTPTKSNGPIQSWKAVEPLKPGEDRDLGELRSVKIEAPYGK